MADGIMVRHKIAQRVWDQTERIHQIRCERKFLRQSAALAHICFFVIFHFPVLRPTSIGWECDSIEFAALLAYGPLASSLWPLALSPRACACRLGSLVAWSWWEDVRERVICDSPSTRQPSAVARILTCAWIGFVQQVQGRNPQYRCRG